MVGKYSFSLDPLKRPAGIRDQYVLMIYNSEMGSRTFDKHLIINCVHV